MVVIAFYLFILNGCTTNSKTQPDDSSLEAKSNDLVFDYYKNLGRKIDLKELIIVQAKPYKTGYLVLSWYKGEGPELTLFYIEKGGSDLRMVNKETVEPAASLGFEVNRTFKTLL